MRVSGSLAAVLLALAVVGLVGCKLGEDREPPDGEVALQQPEGPGTQADESPVVPHPESAGGGGEASAAAAADVIRTRIAWRRHAEEGVPWPTPTPPPPIPVSAAGGAVSAPEIGLMWTESAAGMFEFEDAVEYCRGLSTAGFQDWRMPSVTELELLLTTEFRPAWIGGVPRLWSATEDELRGVVTVLLPEVTRSRQAVGMAHVLCVRRIE